MTGKRRNLFALSDRRRLQGISACLSSHSRTYANFPNDHLTISSTSRQETAIMTPLQYPDFIGVFTQDMRRHGRERTPFARMIGQEGHRRLIVVV